MAELPSIIRRSGGGHWERGSVMTSTDEKEINSGRFISFSCFFFFWHFLFEVGVNANLSEILRGLKEG